MKFISHYLTFLTIVCSRTVSPPSEVNLINLYSQLKLTIPSQGISVKFELALRLELNLRIITNKSFNHKKDCRKCEKHRKSTQHKY